MNQPQNPRLAINLILLSTAFIAVTTLLAKAIGAGKLGDPLHPLQISHGRFMFAFIGFAIATAIRRPTFTKPNIRRHLARTLFGWAGVSMMFAAVSYIPLGEATAISFLNPVFAMVLAIPLLGERVGPVRWLAAGLSMIGAIILLQPGSAAFQPVALIAVGAAVFLGMELIFIKRLAVSEPPFQVLLINNAIGFAIASVVVLPFWAMPNLAQWFALIGIGGFMACAQTLFVNSMARADASLLAPFTYITLIFAALYDFVIFGVIPVATSILGAAIIVSGAVLLTLREAQAKKQAAIRLSDDNRA